MLIQPLICITVRAVRSIEDAIQRASTIVDTIYAHTVDSGLAGVSHSVEERVGLKSAEQPAPTDPPPEPRSPPRLRVIEGGRPTERSDQRDTR